VVHVDKSAARNCPTLLALGGIRVVVADFQVSGCSALSVDSVWSSPEYCHVYLAGIGDVAIRRIRRNVSCALVLKTTIKQ
jgi:hypothetical protein